jgi:hypothetical protein
MSYQPFWGSGPARKCVATTWKFAKMWDWFPIIFIPFKLIVLGTGMYFAIKWHHDQAKKK